MNDKPKIAVASNKPQAKRLPAAERLRLKNEARNRARIQNKPSEELDKELRKIEIATRRASKESVVLWNHVDEALKQLVKGLQMVQDSLLAFTHERFAPLLKRMDIEQTVFDAKINTMAADLRGVTQHLPQLTDIVKKNIAVENSASGDLAAQVTNQIQSMMDLLLFTIKPNQDELFEQAQSAYLKYISVEKPDPESQEYFSITLAYQALQISVMSHEEKVALVEKLGLQKAEADQQNVNVVSDVEFKETPATPAEAA